MLSATQIIAHRGASHDAPENTLAAIELAWRQGADAAEIDVHLSCDGHILVCHDSNTRRTTGVAGKISELTLAQIQELDAGSWKGSQWQGEKMPTLDEVLARLPEDKRLVVEIKCGAEILPSLEAVLGRAGQASERLTFIGFDVPTMAQVKERLPHISALLLFDFLPGTPPFLRKWAPRVDQLIAKAQEVGADGLNLSATAAEDLSWIEVAKAAGLTTYVWTVDDAERASHLVQSGIDGITTNRPGWLREQLAI